MTNSFLLKHIVLNAYLRREILRLLAEIRLWAKIETALAYLECLLLLAIGVYLCVG